MQPLAWSPALDGAQAEGFEDQTAAVAYGRG
jgi:hypothetical protein